MSMKLLKSVDLKVFSLLIVSSLILHLPNSRQMAEAALMKPESALHQALERNKYITQFYLELKVSVFDPEAFAPLNEEADSNLKPYPIPEQSYTQNIVFVRDEIVAIETLNESGEALHIYFGELGGKEFSMNLGSGRVFKDEDVYYPCLSFFTKHLAQFEKELNRYEIAPSQLTYIQHHFMMLYRVGTESNNLQIDPDTFKVLGLESLIQIQGRYFPLKIIFSEWNLEKDSIPELTSYYINSRLFKESRIINIQFRRIYEKRNQFITKYKSLFPPGSPFSIEVNYGQ